MAFSRVLQTGDDRGRDIVQVCMPTAVLYTHIYVLCSYNTTRWILDATCHWCMVSLPCVGTPAYPVRGPHESLKDINL